MSRATDIAKTMQPRARPIIGIGRVLLWSGGSLWIGREVGLADRHAHHAIQISLAMRGQFAMDDGERGSWREHLGAIVMPHRQHRFDGRGSDVAMIFVEPETQLGRALLTRFGVMPVASLDPVVSEAL